MYICIIMSTRCEPYFGATVEAVQCLTYQTEWNVRTCQKREKTCSCFGMCGRKNFFTLSPSYAQSHKNREKSLCPTVLQLRGVISTRWGKNITPGFQYTTKFIETDFVEESRQKMQRSEEDHVFGEEGFDRKEYVSNTANKRCSRQMLQLRCSSSYSIKFYT